MRKLIHEADPEVVETWKWMGTPVWEHGGIICTGETYKAKVKLTFAKGASLKDPSKLFNSRPGWKHEARYRYRRRRGGRRGCVQGARSRRYRLNVSGGKAVKRAK